MNPGSGANQGAMVRTLLSTTASYAVPRDLLSRSLNRGEIAIVPGGGSVSPSSGRRIPRTRPPALCSGSAANARAWQRSPTIRQTWPRLDLACLTRCLSPLSPPRDPVDRTDTRPSPHPKKATHALSVGMPDPIPNASIRTHYLNSKQLKVFILSYFAEIVSSMCYFDAKSADQFGRGLQDRQVK